MKKSIENLRKKYGELSDACAGYLAGTISSSDLKKTTAPLGIYEQRNGELMMRIRIPGGQISLEDAVWLASLLEEMELPYIHLSARQDMQMHNVPLDKAANIAELFLEREMPFHGGGADTFRNITACPHGGFSEGSVFDTTPCAQALSDFLMNVDEAFSLPRKFKIALSCCENDFAMAKFNDLGFIAREGGNRKGFEVFAGGGMGRESMAGTKIFDFIRIEDIFKITLAAIHFFHEHGRRDDRQKARFRFVRQNMGEENFRNKFVECLSDLSDNVQSYKPDESALANKDGSHLARLFVPAGNLNRKQLTEITSAAIKHDAKFLRISQDQDIFAGPFAAEQADAFSGGLPEFGGKKIAGLIKSCVGAKICKIGILDAPSTAMAASMALDKFINEISDEQKSRAINWLISSVKISGCQNSCGLNRAVEIGFQGMRKKIGGEMRGFYSFQSGGCPRLARLSEDSKSEIPDEELPSFLLKIVKEKIRREHI